MTDQPKDEPELLATEQAALEGIEQEMEQRKAALQESRARLLTCIETALTDGTDDEGIESVEIVDPWTLCVRVDGVDLAVTVTAA